MSGPRKNRCATGTQNSLNNGQPVIEYFPFLFTFPFVGVGRVMRDVPIAFSKPRHIIGVSSVTNQDHSCNIYMHFQPLNYPVSIPSGGSIVITPNGGEPWIPLASPNSNGLVEGRFIVFKKPVQNFLVDIDHPNGGVGNGILVTFFGADDLQAALLERT